MDHRTQECVDGIFLFADASDLGRVSRSTNEAALASLPVGFGPLCAGAVE